MIRAPPRSPAAAELLRLADQVDEFGAVTFPVLAQALLGEPQHLLPRQVPLVR